ncbi:serine hydrolase [Roseomonas mucosa]|nr:serine hydrolase [Acetobacteraceae bacterium]
MSPDRDTVFEVGSVTKVFTALLLADMPLRGEVHLEDAVSRHLPGISACPRSNGVHGRRPRGRVQYLDPAAEPGRSLPVLEHRLRYPGCHGGDCPRRCAHG